MYVKLSFTTKKSHDKCMSTNLFRNKANAFESIVRNVSKNKDCALVIYVHINAFLDTKYHTHALSSQINLETFLKK